jgi:DNA-binding CsgD family transcriptional regulator
MLGLYWRIIEMQTKNLSTSSVALLHPFPHLVVHAEDGDQLFPLTNTDYWTIGRGYNNSIVLTDKWVSRNHATIQIVGSANLEVINSTLGKEPVTKDPNDDLGVFYLVDLGSRNGSFVRGQRVTFPALLKSGDRFMIGKTEMDFFTPHKRETDKVTDNLHLFQQPTAPVTRSTLTPSEDRVFWQVVQGFTNKEIGKRLQISPRTVQTHLSSIMTKLNLENRSQIVRFAYEHVNRPHDNQTV